MIRHLIAGTAAAAVIILAAAVFLWATPVQVQACDRVVASWYGAESGNRTADGSYFDGSQLVAAHRSLKFGTRLKVTYRGKSVVVVVRDRGPFIRGRQLDLSQAAAKQIGMIRSGVATVCVTRVR